MVLAISAEHESDQTPEAEPLRERVTFRAIVWGVVTLLGMSIYLTYWGRNLVKTYMPVASMLPLVGWVCINMVLKWVAPKRALNRMEILTIFSMCWVAGNLPAVGWALHSISDISGPHFYASPENRLGEVVLPFLPQWLFLDARQYLVYQLYTGLDSGDALPWALWIRPLFWWLAGSLSVVMAGFCVSVLMFKQWHERERLVFPMAMSQVRSRDDGAPISYRTARLGLLCATVFIAGWFTSTGMAIWVTILQLILMFICFMGVTKYAATTGFTFLNPPGAKGGHMLRLIGGTEHLSPGSQTMLTQVNRNLFMGAARRVTSIPSQVHMFRMLAMLWSDIQRSGRSCRLLLSLVSYSPRTSTSIIAILMAG